MKKIFSILLATVALFAIGCSPENPEEGGKTTEITVNFTTDKETAVVDEPIVLTPTVTGGVAPYAYMWECTDDITSTDEVATIAFTSSGVKLIKLTVTDSKGSKRSKSTTFVVGEKPIEDKGDIKLNWYIDFADEGGGVRSSSPAIDDNGNIYLLTSQSGTATIRKVSSDGQSNQSVTFAAPGNSDMSVSIDKDNDIYVGGGTSSGGGFHKFSSALSKSWSAEFWNKGNAASPKIWYGAAVQLSDYVLVANAGSTGTMGAIKKADGKRKSYVTSEEGGGPSGGCRQSPVVSNDGYVWQVCAAKGIIGTTVSKLTTTDGAVTYDYFVSLHEAESGNVALTSSGSDRPAMCVASVKDVNYAFGVCTPEGNSTQIVKVAKDGSASAFVINASNTSIANETAQDQGGCVVGLQGEIIANLKSSAAADGGIVAINGESMTLSWEYRIAEEVSCCPAVTKEGNVIFGTDNGNFYIIKPNYADKTAELVAKADINAILKDAGIKVENEEVFNIKMWSNVTIADDGVIYIGFQRNDSTTSSGLLSLKSSAVTGPANTKWPMFGVDRKHTGVQK